MPCMNIVVTDFVLYDYKSINKIFMQCMSVIVASPLL